MYVPSVLCTCLDIESNFLKKIYEWLYWHVSCVADEQPMMNEQA